MAEMKVQGRIPVVVPDHLDGAVAAGNSPRVKAKLVDIFVYLLGLFITFGIPRLHVSVQPSAAALDNNSWSAVLIVFWPLFGIILVAAYALLSIFWVSREGQTPGMKIALIRWIRLDDGARGGGSSIKKFTLEVLSGFLTAGLFPLVVWLTSQGEVNRTWFDRVCGTLTISLNEGVDPSAMMGRSHATRRKQRAAAASTSDDTNGERRYALSARPDNVVARDVSVIGDVPSIGAPAEEMGAEPAPVTSIPIEMSRDYDDIRQSLEQARQAEAEQDAVEAAMREIAREVEAEASGQSEAHEDKQDDAPVSSGGKGEAPVSAAPAPQETPEPAPNPFAPVSPAPSPEPPARSEEDLPAPKHAAPPASPTAPLPSRAEPAAPKHAAPVDTPPEPAPDAEHTEVATPAPQEPQTDRGSVFAPQPHAPRPEHPAPFEVELEPDIDLTTVRGVPLIPSATTHDSDEGLGVLERTLGCRPVGSIRLVFDDGTRYDLVGGAIIGRDPVVPETEPTLRRLSIVDPSRSVSKTHLKVTVQGEAVLVEDLHSTNGTRITPPTGDSRSLTPGTPELAEPGSSVVFGRRTFVIGG